MNTKKLLILTGVLLTLLVCNRDAVAQGNDFVIDSFFDVFVEIDTTEEWMESLYGGGGGGGRAFVKAMTESEWMDYMGQWEDPGGLMGPPYPTNDFSPPELYVHEDPAGLDEGFLVMAWGDQGSMDMSTSSAWKLTFGQDPDLSNVTIHLSVGPPPGINVVSFGMRDINGRIRAWYWNVPGTIPNGPPSTPITINTAVFGPNAANPVADSFVNTPGFDPTQVIDLIVDENFQWVGGPIPPPPPGQTLPRPWNWWDYLVIKPNPRIPQGLGVGVNIDVHQDTNDPSSTYYDPTMDPDDFHLRGWIKSGHPAGNWGSPPVLLVHVDDPLWLPNFTHTIVPGNHPMHPGQQNWYRFEGTWWGPRGIPWCTKLHLGLKFEVFCHNIIIDLTGWWTKDGQPVPGRNNGHVGAVGFNVQDEEDPDVPQNQTVSIILGDGIHTNDPGPGIVETEIVALSLVSMTPIEVETHLGPEPFKELRDGGLESTLPWIEMLHNGQPLNEDTGNTIFLSEDPLLPAIDSFFDVFVELDVAAGAENTLATPTHIDPEDVVIVRTTLKVTDNNNQPSYRRIWHWHNAHPAERDLGDAPDSTNTWGIPMTAYPWGIPARYPTVYRAGSPAFGPIHWFPRRGAFLGRSVTVEREADIGPDQDPTNNIIPRWNIPNRDRADDGVQNLPLLMPHCIPISFNYMVTIVRPQQYYVNVWFDYNRDGDWDDTLNCPGPLAPLPAPEHAVVDQPVGFAAPGTYMMTTPMFRPWNPSLMPWNVTAAFPRRMPIWMRITISEQKWQGSGPAGGLIAGGSGTANGYKFGETEDYYFIPRKVCCIDCPDFNGDGIINLVDWAWFASYWLKHCSPNLVGI